MIFLLWSDTSKCSSNVSHCLCQCVLWFLRVCEAESLQLKRLNSPKFSKVFRLVTSASWRCCSGDRTAPSGGVQVFPGFVHEREKQRGKDDCCCACSDAALYPSVKGTRDLSRKVKLSTYWSTRVPTLIYGYVHTATFIQDGPIPNFQPWKNWICATSLFGSNSDTYPIVIRALWDHKPKSDYRCIQQLFELKIIFEQNISHCAERMRSQSKFPSQAVWVLP